MGGKTGKLILKPLTSISITFSDLAVRLFHDLAAKNYKVSIQ
jgi:hypothetical protein